MIRSLADLRDRVADRIEDWMEQRPDAAPEPPLPDTPTYLVRLPRVGALDARMLLAAWMMRPDIEVQDLRAPRG